MRSAIIPAQIITVEDRIAGSLTLPQITILMIPLIFSLLIYITLPPRMQFSTLKILLCLTTGLFALFLSIRIKEKIIASWIIILLTYQIRPGIYLYNKNDSYGRLIDYPNFSKNKLSRPIEEKKEQAVHKQHAYTAEKMRFAKLLINPTASLRIIHKKNGGVHYATY